MNSVLEVTPEVFREIRGHGEETYPDECCGVLLGRASEDRGLRASEAVRAENTRVDSAHNRYSISPQQLIRIQRTAREGGLDVVGFYHSHPDHPAQPSSTDLQEAHWFGCAYVITAVAKGRAADTNAFLLAGVGEEEKHFEGLSIETGSKANENSRRARPDGADEAAGARRAPATDL